MNNLAKEIGFILFMLAVAYMAIAALHSGVAPASFACAAFPHRLPGDVTAKRDKEIRYD